MVEQNLFMLDPELKGRNKRIFADTIKNMSDGTVIKISPFTAYLRKQGCTSSESTIERYIRWTKTWFAPSMFKSMGKGKYIFMKNGSK